MRAIKKIFAPKEVKITLNIIDEVSLNYQYTVFQKIKDFMERAILSESKVYVNTIRSGTTPRQWVFTTLANKAGDLLESGYYHLYRGVLNPIGKANELLKIYDSAVDELNKMEIIDKETAAKQKKALRDNLKDVG